MPVPFPSVKRKDMIPGDIFIVRLDRPHKVCTFVVLDAQREIEFWTGSLALFGNIAPFSHFEVIS